MSDYSTNIKQALPDWHRPDCDQHRRMPAQSYLIPFPDQKSCESAISDNQRYLSPYLLQLGGAWETKYYSSITQVPEQILMHRSGFESVQIPQWSQSSVKQEFPFMLDYPSIPQDQPVQVYRRKQKIPFNWGSFRKRLVLQGVKSACHIYINGRYTGFAEGSGLPAAFDVTQQLHEGENDIFILVWPLSQGSYFEKQTTLPGPAILRDLYLEAAPPISLYDVQIKTEPLEDMNAWKLIIKSNVISYRISMDQPIIRLTLVDQDEKLHESKWPVVLRALKKEDETYPSPVQSEGSLAIQTPLYGLESWHCEKPRLYDLYISIEDRQGREYASYRLPVGFRYLEQSAEGYLLNGQPLRLHAVSWQEAQLWQEAPDTAAMIRQIRRIKQHHFNTLFIEGLPPDPILLELCDIYGLYVVCQLPADYPALLQDSLLANQQGVDMLLSRSMRLIARDKAHPSVLAWSVPAMAANGDLRKQLQQTFKQLDDTRLWHYLDFPDLKKPVMNWREGIPRWLEEPAALGEIGLCLGRWLPAGSLEEASDADPTVGRKTVLPCLLDKNGKPNVWLQEISYSLRPLLIEPVDAAAGAFNFKNRLQTLAASVFKVSWVLLRNGEFLLSGEMDPLRIQPGDTHFKEIWYGDIDLDDGSTYQIRFEVVLAAQWLWAGFGQPISQETITIRQADTDFSKESAGRGQLRTDQDRHHLIISGPRFWFVFNTINGRLESWRMHDQEFLDRHPPLEGVSPMVDPVCQGLVSCYRSELNDLKLVDWQRQLVYFDQACDGQHAVVTIQEKTGLAGHRPLLSIYTRYEISHDGLLRIFYSISGFDENSEIVLPPLPGLYLHLPLRDLFSLISWQGRGPEPGLAGYQPSVQPGCYEIKRADLDKTVHDGAVYGDCDWLQCGSRDGIHLVIESDASFAFSVAAVRKQQLLNHRHQLDLRLYSTIAKNMQQPHKALFSIRPVLH